MTLASEKKSLRTAAREKRAALARETPDFARRIAAYTDELPIPAGATVSAYRPMGDEAGLSLLLARLELKGCRIVFPRVAAKAAPLDFHHAPPNSNWENGGEWVTSGFGVSEPAPHWPLADPEILLVPLLAFDAHGYRLGYGGGFYDRTLAKHRALRPVTAIGVAYAGQEVARVPHGAHDQRLDAILTERGFRRFAAPG